MSISTLVKTNGLTIGFKNRTLINDASFEINEGDLILLKGDNGSGKSTLLKYITRQSTSRKISYSKGLKIAFIPQALYFANNVEKIIDDYIYAFNTNVSKQDIVSAFSLQTLLSKDYSKLSTGEKQRVILGISFLDKPDLIILDEFSDGLDVGVKAEVIQLLLNIKKRNSNIAFLIISHDSFVNKISSKANKTFEIKNGLLEVTNG